MKLILTVTSKQRTGLGADSRHVFDSRGGSIGRAPESDWILPDVNRIVSNQHLVIDFRDGDFYLTDTSTNGVFLNDADMPLGYNRAARVREGDMLGIGEYRIHVEVDSKDRSSIPIARADSPQQVDGAVFESAWSESVKYEPLPLGLSGENEPRLSSESLLPILNGQGRADDEFNHPASEPDHKPAINEAFVLPAIHAEQLPEDWDRVVVNDEVGGAEGVSPHAPPLSDDGLLPSQPPHASISPVSPLKPSRHDTPADVAPQLSFDSNLNGISEFLRGAGIDSAKAHIGNSKLSLEFIGRLYREMVQGVMDVLIARSSLKNEFRMSHTIIRATENNPLKFSMTVDDAIEYLLFKEGKGFLPPEEAFHEAYQDIKDHQIATVVGMRAAFNALMRMFAPEQLQSKLNSGGKWRGMLSFNKGAANWEGYKEWYAELAADSDDHFQKLFAGEFGRAYEEQIARLSEARRQGKS
ncbi:MAG: type VI secretion system-associated FHA domain protein TagH [Candidatus Promineifilaceae bacterium]